MRALTAIAASLWGKRPPGWVLRKRDGVLGAVFGAFAEPIADAERDAALLIDEMDPRSAVRLLPDFERVLGPDPCGRDLASITLDQRQRLAHQRWTARGGQSIPYFMAIAARLGATVVIEEFWPSKAGVLCAGQSLIAEGEQFTWRVRTNLIASWLFRAGANVAGDPLGGFELSSLDCEFRRLKPAHTQIVLAALEES